MLHIVGLGLDDGEITQKGVQAVKDAEAVFAEFYTNTETVDIQKIEEETGQEIEKLSREQVEQKDKILESAKEKDTVFLVSGDPITATTHYDIKHRAEQEGLETEIIHAPSILTSIAETGLNVYKFGRVVTLPENAKPESIIDHIEKNYSVGLHTLVLLDINYDAEDAAGKLAEMNPELEGTEVIIVERANAEDQEISIQELGEVSNLGDTPHSIIFPGETSHKEDEFIEAFR